MLGSPLPKGVHRHAIRTNFRVILRYSAAFVSHSALHGKKPRVRHEPNARRLPVHAKAKTVLRTSGWHGKMEDRCGFQWRFGSHAQRKAHGLKSRKSLRQIFHQRPSKGPRLSRSFALPKGATQQPKRGIQRRGRRVGSAGASPSQRGYTDTQYAQISALFCVIPRPRFPLRPPREETPCSPRTKCTQTTGSC